ncbi:hypothetical protein ACFXQA_10025 [Microbacterium sp. P07]|uniref:hypothetical protein n=1 Tax=Microbacterium sp. P07 TaxID=3366952 RepID=UPI0037474222
MTKNPGTTWHTHRSAAKRVGRSRRTIRNWRVWGMPMGWQVIDGQRTRVVREDLLLEHSRLHMKQNPVHQLRLRAQRRALSETA